MRKYILWDHDGVLVDTEYWFFRATQMSFAELSINLDQQTYLEYQSIGRSTWDIVREAGISEPSIKEQRKRRYQIYRQFLKREDIEIPNVPDVLAKLAGNYRMAIVTMSRREDFNLIHESRNIMSYMEFVLTVEDHSTPKPNPDPYLTAMNRFGATSNECIIIEDSLRGLNAALAANIDCIIVKNPFTGNSNFTGAYKVLDSIVELPSFLSGENHF